MQSAQSAQNASKRSRAFVDEVELKESCADVDQNEQRAKRGLYAGVLYRRPSP